jgi:hypothetical protein
MPPEALFLRNQIKEMVIPHILAPGFVRNLKATLSPPLD